VHLVTGHGLLFPTALVHGPLFAVLAAFVAINTVMYACLALATMLPKIYLSDLWTSANRRVENRSIYPTDVVPVDVPDPRGELVPAGAASAGPGARPSTR
jgi:hypothetical protein